MDKLLGILAVTILGLGARHCWMRLKNKDKRALSQRKLEVWEGEGGAVPVAPHRTAAQVRPRRRRRASPRADA